MKPDALWLAEDGNFDLVVPASPAARFASYSWAVIALLLGPALIVTLDVVGELHWLSVLGGLAVLVFVGGFGLLSAVSTLRMQRRVERISRRGRPATAEVLGSRAVSLGEETGTEVALRIAGDEVPAFETRYRGTAGAIDRLGARFEVLVDPADRAYLIAPVRRSRRG